MPVVYHQSWFKRCAACGYRLQTIDERLRKCPACGRPRLVKTGRMSLVVGEITVSSGSAEAGRGGQA